METFVGAGGSYLGLKKAGFKTIYVNEIDKNFTKTLTYNNEEDLKNCIVDIRPIEDVNFKEIRKIFLEFIYDFGKTKLNKKEIKKYLIKKKLIKLLYM